VKEGTAVAMDEQGRFYLQVLEDFCSRGEGVYRLRVDGQVVGKAASMSA
jgi:hypothetical protein